MWLKVDDKLHDHPKTQLLLERGQIDALGLWLVAGSWCGDQLSDGLISAYVLGRFHPDWRRLAEQLVDAGLWLAETTDDGRLCYRFHDWLSYNHSRERVLRDRAFKETRDAIHRDPALKAAVCKRDKNRCRYCGALVNWRVRNTPDSGTYDHVTPLSQGGLNTLANLVVACRSCNSRKGGRTPAEAGMRKLPAGSMGGPHLADEGSATGSGRVGSGRVRGSDDALDADPAQADDTETTSDEDGDQ